MHYYVFLYTLKGAKNNTGIYFKIKPENKKTCIYLNV